MARDSRIHAAAWLVFAAPLWLTCNAEAAPPPNDYPPGTVISGLPYAETADVSEASSEGMITRCGYLDLSVWYNFTPGSPTRVESRAVGNDGSYTVLVVFAGYPDRSTELGCGSGGPFGPAAGFNFNATAGVTYYFAIGTVPFSPGGAPSRIDFSLTQGPPPPDNDEIEGARPIGALPFSDTLSTLTATTASDDPTCFGSQGATVWYSFTAPADLRLELNTFGSDYTTTLSVYTGSRGSLTQIACNAFSSGGSGARVRFDAQANVTYHVMVGSFSAEGANLVLNAAIAPPPFTFDLQLDRKGSVDASTGVATVRGTATCSLPAFVNVSGSLFQSRPDVLIDAFFMTAFFCEGTTSWSAQVFYTPRLFHGRSVALFVAGRADANVFANAFSPGEGEFRFASATGGLHLTGVKK